MLDDHAELETVSDPKRRNMVLYLFYAMSAIFLARLWYLQILKGRDFSIAAMRNRIREVIQLPPRGMIYDASNKILLSNQLFYDLIIIPQYLQNKEKTLVMVSKLFHIPEKVLDKKINEAKSTPKFVPISVKKNLSFHEVATLESVKFFLPGVEITSVPRRDYTGNESAHLLGYLGEVTPKDLDILNSQNPNEPYHVGSIIGKTGVESKYEKYLRGQEGKDILLVDAFGRLQTESDYNFIVDKNIPSEKGNDIYLTIDADIQNAAIDAFRNKNGALCAMDTRTGAILAYMSNPNFKLSIYQDGLTANDWQILRANPFKPLLDKVTGGAYPPGSTFKTVVALAALEEGIIKPDTRINCPGYFNLGNHQWKCDKHTGHGVLDLPQAIALSCDVYFFTVGRMLGIDPITKWAKLFGLGEKTGLDLNMELSGIVPSTDWKLRTKGIPWTGGDTINASIGQGFNLYTPLQVLNMMATMGNGGNLYKPHLLKKVVSNSGKILYEEKPTLIRKIPINPVNLEAVKKGLLGAVTSGTATKAQVTGFTVAGKTGTAQNSTLKATKGKSRDDIPFQTLDHAWFTGYSPSDDPQIAVVVFSEYDGGFGGSNAAPIAQKVIEAYWKKNEKSYREKHA